LCDDIADRGQLEIQTIQTTGCFSWCWPVCRWSVCWLSTRDSIGKSHGRTLLQTTSTVEWSVNISVLWELTNKQDVK